MTTYTLIRNPSTLKSSKVRLPDELYLVDIIEHLNGMPEAELTEKLRGLDEYMETRKPEPKGNVLTTAKKMIE